MSRYRSRQRALRRERPQVRRVALGRRGDQVLVDAGVRPAEHADAPVAVRVLRREPLDRVVAVALLGLREDAVVLALRAAGAARVDLHVDEAARGERPGRLGGAHLLAVRRHLEQAREPLVGRLARLRHRAGRRRPRAWSRRPSGRRRSPRPSSRRSARGWSRKPWRARRAGAWRDPRGEGRASSSSTPGAARSGEMRMILDSLGGRWRG